MLEQLYKLTPMEDSFGINTVALVDGQPRTLGLKEMLEVFLDHRFDVVRRRSVFRRGKAADRLHLVEGLLVAILDIDEVIQLIRSSDDAEQARERLMSVFDLTEIQANYILDMPLRRLTKFSRIELEKERTELEATIAALDAILERRRAAAQGRLRRAGRGRQDLRHPAPHGAAGLGGPDRSRRPCRSRSPTTRAGCSSPPPGCSPAPATPRRPGDGGGRAKHDVVVSAVRATARGEVGALTSHGPRAAARRARPARRCPARPTRRTCPAARRSASSSPWSPASGCSRSDPLTDEGPGLALGTRQGVVKRVNPETLSNKDAWEVIRLADGDEVVGAVELATGEEELCFVTTDAQLLRFPARTRSGRRAAPAAAWPASGWPPASAWSSSAPSPPTRTRWW